ncbi:RNA polymerase sigma factor SigI [compost metagenome]
MIQVAKHFSEQPEWVEILKKTKRLPIRKMLKFSKVVPKTLERNRKYIIALVLIYACPEFEGIRSIVSFANIEE